MPDTRGADVRRKRGRPSRVEQANPTGYRATNATRRQLEMARQFTGHGSLQAIIDAAVRAYLSGLVTSTPDLRQALRLLDPALLVDLGLDEPAINDNP
ncbi:MAG: hypothetical protein ACLP52_10025 [Streptosporangiaceae bacterium]